MKNLGSKIYTSYCFSMGVYGFNRGYRAKNENRYELTTDKCLNGMINGIVYSAPVINIIPTYRLLNRLEIKYKNLNKDDYNDNYKETIGICNDTI